MDLFDEAELEVALAEFETQLPEEDLITPPAKQTRRRGFSENLNRVRIELPLSEEEKAGAQSTFFTKVKEELEFIPAQLNVVEYWQEKAVFPQADGADKVVAATRPTHPLGKCFASTSSLAHIIVAKYADGLPLYRQEGILNRYGGNVSRSCMANWIVRLEKVFKPLLKLVREVQNDSDYLQADGYSGYGQVCAQNGIKRIGCLYHARRKFVEAVKASEPAKQKRRKGQPTKADVALGKIRK